MKISRQAKHLSASVHADPLSTAFSSFLGCHILNAVSVTHIESMLVAKVQVHHVLRCTKLTTNKPFASFLIICEVCTGAIEVGISVRNIMDVFGARHMQQQSVKSSHFGTLIFGSRLSFFALWDTQENSVFLNKKKIALYLRA